MISRTLFLLLIASPAIAAEQANTTGGGSVLRMIGSLLVVLGLIYLAYALVPRWNKFVNKLALKSGKKIQVIECTAIAPKRNLCLVKIGEETMLLGVTAQSINYLASIDANADSFQDTISRTQDKSDEA